IEGNVQDPMVRNLFYSLLRTASYVVAPDLQAAGPVLQQLKHALKGVLYLDRGWGAMVDELKQKALEQGVQIVTKNKVISVDHHEGRVRHVLCGDGMKIEANHIILTIPPAVAHELVPHAEETALHT
ncbi:dehydrogenase, partial [Clostridium perfringens]